MNKNLCGGKKKGNSLENRKEMLCCVHGKGTKKNNI